MSERFYKEHKHLIVDIRNKIKLVMLWVGSLLKRNQKSKILYYHDVFRTTNHKALDADIKMGTPLNLFKEHVRIIREEGYEIVSKITKLEGQVAIMFDDGFNGIWECKDYFYKEGICPTVFLPIAFVGDTTKGILTKEQVLELQKHGFIFECHGWSHLPLTEVTEIGLTRELKGSREYLNDLLNKQITGICLPLGYFSIELLNQIHNAGFTDIYSSIPGHMNKKTHGMHHRNLCQYASAREVKLILRGGNEILQNRYEIKHNRS